MPIQFNNLLKSAGVNLEDTILVRHRDDDFVSGRSICALWRQSPAEFDAFQSEQAVGNRAKFSRAGKWASFIGLRDGKTVFVGLYDAAHKNFDEARNADYYTLNKSALLGEYEGKVFIEWGDGARAWVQRADRQDKIVSELRLKFEEEPFPGHLNFIEPLSMIESLPPGWLQVLRSSWGVYLLTCPRTNEQYVGSVAGEEGFWQRWLCYARTGHGGNIALKSREISDYQVTILEVAGNNDDVLKMEERWKRKLQSRDMGLNRD